MPPFGAGPVSGFLITTDIEMAAMTRTIAARPALARRRYTALNYANDLAGPGRPARR